MWSWTKDKVSARLKALKHRVLRWRVALRRRVLIVLLRHQKINSRQIVFESYLARSFADSPKAIYEYMLSAQKYKEYRFVWAFVDPSKYSFLENERTKVVKYRSVGYYLAYARSRYWVVNGWIPFRIEKKSEQIMLQTWHGTPLKRLRNDIMSNSKHATLSHTKVVKDNLRDTKRYDYFISPSKFCTKVFTSAFDLKELGKENTIIEIGYPRNDFLYSYTEKDTKAIKKRLSIPKNKKVILYAPTWRDDQHKKGIGFTYDLGLDFKKLYDKFGKDYVVLFRAHYNIATGFDFSAHQGFVYDVSKVDEVNELYVISDMLITDYSSVFFDYANLRRPILFYMYDLKYYQTELRGFYIDLDELPGPILQTENELYDAIKNVNTFFKEYKQKYNKFNKTYNYLDSAQSSKKVIEKVIG